jgi:hypothetical protein
MAAGIGSGAVYQGTESVVDCLTIVGGDITAKGWSGAGIGSGYGNALPAEGSQRTAVLDLTIVGGSINAVGASNGAAIGGGSKSPGPSFVSNLVIRNGSFTLSSSYYGIGPGHGGSTVGPVTIHNGVFDCSGVTSAHCFDSLSSFDGGPVSVITSSLYVGLTKSRLSASTDLYYEYLSSSIAEGESAPLMIHLASTQLPDSNPYILTIQKIGAGGEAEVVRTVVFNRTRAQGCAFTVPSSGNYQLWFDSLPPGSSGRLTLAGGDLQFPTATSGDKLFSNVGVFSLSTRTPSESSYMKETPAKSLAASMTPCFTDPRFGLRWRTQTILSTSFFMFMIW